MLAAAMRVLIDALHPAHVHFFRPIAEMIAQGGGEVLFAAREKEVTLDLLRAFSLPHETLSGIGGGFGGLARELGVRLARFTALARRFRPDVLAGIMGPVIAPAGRLLGIPSVVFYDTETARATNTWVYPLATVVATPEAWRGPTRSNQVLYPGYHELSYLHPVRFTPDPRVRAELGVGEDEPFALVRLVSFEASHDLGDRGFTDRVGFVQSLARTIRVFVSAERGAPDALRPYVLPTPPDRLHHVLAAATFYVGEGATTAAEAAVLGTPAVFVHTARLGYMLELERRHDLLFNRPRQADAEELCAGWARDPGATRERFAARRAAMLAEKLDVAAFARDLLARVVEGERPPDLRPAPPAPAPAG